MNRFILLISLFFHFSAGAQNLAGIDSIVQANNKHSREDIRKTILLLKLAKGYSQSDPAAAKAYAMQAYEISTKLGYPKSIADALYHLGDISTSSGDYVSGFTYLRKARHIHDSIGIVLGGLVDSLRTCDIWRFKSDHKQAIAGYSYLIESLNLQNDEFDLARAYSGLSASYAARSEFPKAIEANEKSMAINKKYNNSFGLALNYSNLARINSNQSNFMKAIEYYQKAYEINEKISAKFGMSNCLRNIGILYNNMTNYLKAVDYYHKALKIDEELKNEIGIASAYGNLGVVYGRLLEFPKALEYFMKAYDKFSNMNDKYAMSYCLGNIGNIYALQFQDYNKAIEYYQRAIRINEETNDKRGLANNNMSIGMVYNSEKDYVKALGYFKQSLEILEKINDKVNIVSCYNNMSISYESLNDHRTSLEYAIRARQLAKEIKALESEKNALRSISEIYEHMGKWDSAYLFYKDYTIIKDSSSSDVIKSELSKKEMQYEFEKKETEYKFQQQLSDEKLIRNRQELNLKEQALLISTKEKDLERLKYLKKQAELESEKLKRQQKESEFALTEEIKQNQITNLKKENDIARLTESRRLGQMAGLGGAMLSILIVAGVIYYQSKRKQKLNEQLTVVNAALFTEKEKSDNLLLNILPAEIAEELKQKGKADAKQYDAVTVLFTDFVNFTGISQSLSPAVLVNEIDTCFQAFDKIMEKYGVEKIKTIGDAYMAASGLPHASADHAIKAVQAALELCTFITEHNAKGGLFEIRIGLHSGPVIAGIVGNKKFAYDIWGDTVNTAARMEQNSLPGEVNISGATFELIKAEFNCSYRGKIAAKNKGEIDMYFVR